jgi:hypothetical protein
MVTGADRSPAAAFAAEIHFKPAREHDMKSEAKTDPIFNRVIDVFGNWLKHRREMREIRQLDAGIFEHIAHDLRITPAELDTFVRQGPHAADELPRVLEVLGIDEATLARSQPAVLRDMERVCILCERKVQCNNDLEIGVSARDHGDYCLNAPTMDSLSDGRQAVDQRG